jgi:hypothetical protein
VQWSVQTYAEFMAALYALMTVEAITLTEANDFQNQMLNVLGHDPVPLSARVTGLPSVWRGEPHVFVESPLRSLARDGPGLPQFAPWPALCQMATPGEPERFRMSAFRR